MNEPEYVRIQMNEEEWWPVPAIWEITEPEPRSFFITRELFDRFQRLRSEFRQAWDEIDQADTSAVEEEIRREREYGEQEFKRTVSENPDLPLRKTSQ